MPEPKVAAAETVTDTSQVAVPESAFEQSETPAQARDPHTGRYVSVTLGAEKHPEDESPIEGDRGDEIEVSKSQVTEPEVTGTPKDEAAAEEASKPEETKDEDTKDEDTQDEGTQEQRIPKSRFDEVNERRKLAERKTAELQKQLEALTKVEEGGYDFKKAEREYMEMVLDGKFDEAVEKRSEIDAAKELRYKKAATIEALEVAKVDTVKSALDAMSVQAAEDYAEFDPENDAFDEAKVDQVETFYVGYTNRGKSPLEALEKAIEDVVKLHGLRNRNVQSAAPKKGPRNQTVEKVEKSRQQPPVPTTDAGRPADDAGVLHFEQLTDRQLEQLEKENPGAYARMRGDLVA